MTIETIDDHYERTMREGTPSAKVLMTEEALMTGTLIKRLWPGASPEVQKDIQRELMCLLLMHRHMTIAGYLMERLDGSPLAVEGPIVVPGTNANPTETNKS